jgi:hypothetical protein
MISRPDDISHEDPLQKRPASERGGSVMLVGKRILYVIN